MKLKEFFNKYKIYLYFLIAAVVLLIIFPVQRKFKYNFKKGNIWMYEDLQAEFDFPLYKTEDELKKEIDSLTTIFKPYFILDEDITNQKLQYFQNILNQIINQTNHIENRKTNKINKDDLKIFVNELTNITKSLFSNGIISISDLHQLKEKNITKITVVINNVGYDKNISEIYTLKTAYETLIDSIEKIIVYKRNKQSFFQIINNIDFNNILAPNLIYDKYKNKLTLDNLKSSISIYKDKIKRGQLIISKGEIINEEKYNLLTSYKLEYEKNFDKQKSYLIKIGNFIIILIYLSIIFIFLKFLRNEILQSGLKTTFILFLVILNIFVCKIVVNSEKINIYVIPFTILPIILRTFYDERLALFIHFTSTILSGLIVPESYEFIFITFFSGIVAVFNLTNFSRRSKIISTAIKVIIIYFVSYTGFVLIQQQNFKDINFGIYNYFAINGLLILLSYPLIYVFEKIFNFVSDATLMELSDTNQPLLRELAEKAPGTFHHSLLVANLAEEAIINIGGNPLLIRAGALYHDIGKISNPQYFIENQINIVNPHDTLEYEESARIIIKHVEDGINIAKKYKLPEEIINFIKTHHGTTKVRYFYQAFINKFPEFKEQKLEKFHYLGPKPSSKEMAVLMMADAVEATARSIPDITIDKINILIDEIIDTQLFEEQFNEADITFKDIQIVKKVFKHKLENIYHKRISYKQNNEQ